MFIKTFFIDRELTNYDQYYTDSVTSLSVSVHRAPHLLCCRALEVQKYVCAPDALHLRHPINAYNQVV